MSQRIDWEELIEVFLWALDKFARPTFNNLMEEFDDKRYRTLGPRALSRWEAQGILRRQGAGQHARFVISDRVPRNSVAGRDPSGCWEAKWDGRWRLLSFDVPITRNKERLKLWRHLSARNFGYIQQSVWIWPHDMRAILQEIMQAAGIPEIFVGLEADRLFLCTQTELVAAAWDFEALALAQQTFLERIGTLRDALGTTREFAHLARIGHTEWFAYRAAMDRDPLLPKALLPVGYLGMRVLAAHESFRLAFAEKLRHFVQA